MGEEAITLSVTIDGELFREFALFDTLTRKKGWRSPVLFALIFLAFGALCFSQYQRAEQAILMGSVLLTVGLGVPIVYFANFFSSIQKQIKKLGLKEPQSVYTITLTNAPDGIQVETKHGQRLQHEWDKVFGVYRKTNCIYLYVEPNRAYLLPRRDIGERMEALEQLLQSTLSRKNN